MKPIWAGMALAWFFAVGLAEAQDAEAPALLFPNLVAGRLVALNGPNLTPFDTTALAPVQYYAVYYSARWCPPCHAFTPDLVKFYNEFKPSHPNFELIFVSDDNSASEMQAYMKEMAMPWPALTYDIAKAPRFQGNPDMLQWAGTGIPDLVLVDAAGKVLANSYVSGNYVGPYQVLEDIRKLVSATTAPNAAPTPAPGNVIILGWARVSR